jgi:hypothetical protein
VSINNAEANGISLIVLPKEWRKSPWRAQMDEVAEYCRPASLEDLKTLVRSLNLQKVDIWVADAFLGVADLFNTVRAELVESPESEGNALRQAPGERNKSATPLVGLMLNACGETYATLKRSAHTVDLDGTPVRTVSLEPVCGKLQGNEITLQSPCGNATPHHSGQIPVFVLKT